MPQVYVLSCIVVGVGSKATCKRSIYYRVSRVFQFAVRHHLCACVCVCCHPNHSGRQTCGHTNRGHTGFLYLPFVVLALFFFARRIQPFLSLVDRAFELCVPTKSYFFSTGHELSLVLQVAFCFLHEVKLTPAQQHKRRTVRAAWLLSTACT